jgi:hypothetical protein
MQVKKSWRSGGSMKPLVVFYSRAGPRGRLLRASQHSWEAILRRFMVGSLKAARARVRVKNKKGFVVG